MFEAVLEDIARNRVNPGKVITYWSRDRPQVSVQV